MPELTPEQYRAAQSLAEELAQLPVGDREPKLGSIADEVVRGLVRELLEVEPPTDFMETGSGPVSLSGVLDAAAPEDLVGQTVGRYRVTEKLGEGGFGAVYRAEQTEPVSREVALKVIKLGMDTRRVITRFESERQSLALMEHPGIARVLDAGATGAGRPFFVMELVRGAPITEYCRAENLDLSDRLGLFRDVCAAVQHAHTKGVIHRDLKPGNVLVDSSGPAPVVKVIDFGIAKATDQSRVEHSVFTEAGQMIGTPQYMSPEQASGEALDTRTDVYALGVLLYELLAGAPPFDAESLRSAGYAEIQRIIREQEPPRPSTRASRQGSALPSRGEVRAPDIAPDLDWIVVKAMEKDQERRYGTPLALAEDLDRFRRHEPVIASPPSTAYRFRKLIRRNRAAFAASGLIAAALLLGVVGTSVGLVRSNRALDLAEQRRVTAENEREKSQAVTEFLQDMLASANPEQTKGADVTVLEVLERSAESIEDSLADEPLVEAQVRMTIADTYLDLGEIITALPHLERSYELFERELGPNHEDTVEILNRRANILWEMGELTRAEPLSREALERTVATLGAESVEAEFIRSNYANILADLGRLDEAIEQARRSYASSVTREGEMSQSSLNCLNNLASMLGDAGELDEAIELNRRSVELRREFFGDPSRELGVVLNNLGFSLYYKGAETADDALIGEAVEWLEESVRVKEAVFDGPHQDIGFSLISLSAIQLRRGEVESAMGHADGAVLNLESSGVTGWPLGAALSARCAALVGLGRDAEAVPEGERAWAILERQLGADNPRAKSAAAGVARAYDGLGDTETADGWWARSGQERPPVDAGDAGETP